MHKLLLNYSDDYIAFEKMVESVKGGEAKKHFRKNTI